MNILIKLMSIISLVIAPTLAKIHQTSIEKNRQLKMENLILLERSTTGMHSAGQQKVWNLERNSSKNRRTIESDVSKLLDALEADNLIDKSTNTVATRNNWLYIDDVKQSTEVNNKYINYFDGKGDFVTRQQNH